MSPTLLHTSPALETRTAVIFDVFVRGRCRIPHSRLSGWLHVQELDGEALAVVHIHHGGDAIERPRDTVAPLAE
jgi:hypothetical protein